MCRTGGVAGGGALPGTPRRPRARAHGCAGRTGHDGHGPARLTWGWGTPPGYNAGAMKESLSGVIERVTFHSPETGFAVLRVQAQGRRGLVTVVGNLASAVPGEYVEAAGVWAQDRDHGLQFKADELRTTPPYTA